MKDETHINRGQLQWPGLKHLHEICHSLYCYHADLKQIDSESSQLADLL